jgi:hypothetical protein
VVVTMRPGAAALLAGRPDRPHLPKVPALAQPAPENGRGTLVAALAAVSAGAVCRSQPLPHLDLALSMSTAKRRNPAEALFLRRERRGAGGSCLALSQPTPELRPLGVVGTGPTCRAFGSARVSPRTRARRTQGRTPRLLVARCYTQEGGRLPPLPPPGGMGVSPLGSRPACKRTPERGDACGLARGTWPNERLAVWA